MNNFYQSNPNIGLHIFWYDAVDLTFLKHLPYLKNFAISSYLMKDFSPIADYLDLTDLSLGETKSTAVQTDFIKSFKGLKSFYNDGMKKGLEAIASLEELESLTLRGVKMDNLNIVNKLTHLHLLKLLFGSYKDLSAISNLKNLEKLEISRTRQIPNFDFLQGLENLHELCFEGMSKMERLPSLNGLKNLSTIQIDNNSKLINIESLHDLKQLKKLLLFLPENFKVSWRNELIEQAYNYLVSNQSVKSTNIWRFLNDEKQQVLRNKGIDYWGYNPEVEQVFN